MMKLVLWTLPRWFAAPVLISSVILGWVVSVPLSWWVLLPIACGLCMMAWGHTMNTLLDWSWTGLDKGLPDERSKPKPYTSGQQAIASGRMTENQVLIVAVSWAFVSAIPLAVVVLRHPEYLNAAWLIWAASVSVTFLYSWGKLHWCCELALGVGFGPLACLLGAVCTGSPDYSASLLVGLPVLLIFGGACEVFDQWWDAEANWDRGLRNIGAWVWKKGWPVRDVVGWIIAATFLVQVVLIIVGVLSLSTAPAYLAGIALFWLNKAAERKPWAVLLLLCAVFYYCVMLAVGQVIGA